MRLALFVGALAAALTLIPGGTVEAAQSVSQEADAKNKINLSGRQRMLTQKASKEFCTNLAGVDAPGYRTSLKGTVSLFQDSMVALLLGDPSQNIVPPYTTELRIQLQYASELWLQMRDALDAAQDEGADLAEATEIVAGQNDTLLAEMNKAVGMYSQ